MDLVGDLVPIEPLGSRRAPAENPPRPLRRSLEVALEAVLELLLEVLEMLCWLAPSVVPNVSNVPNPVGTLEEAL